MTIINRYILRAFFRVFALSLSAFSGIYLLADFFEKVDDFLEHGARFSLYLRYFSAKIPLIVAQITPMAILMGVFMGIGALSRTNELTAMRASGISLYRITLPLLGISVLTAFLLLGAGEFVVPLCSKTMNGILQVEVKGRTASTQGSQNIWYREGKNIIHIKAASPEKNGLQGITILQMDNDFRMNSRIDAPSAIFSGNNWILQNPSLRRFDPLSGELLSQENRSEVPFDLGKDADDFVLRKRNPIENMGYRDLRAFAAKLRAEGYDPTRYMVDMHGKLASPFSCLIMAFLAIPFALSKGRKTSLALGITLSVSIGIAFFLIQALLMSFGYAAILPPVVAAWSSNILFGLLGLWMLISVRQ